MNGSGKSGREQKTGGNAAGSFNAEAHVLEELRWLNRLLAAHVLRLRQAGFYDGPKNFRGFFIADEEIDALLAAGVFETGAAPEVDERQRRSEQLCEQAQNLRSEIDRHAQAALEKKLFLPLAHLAECFQLSAFEYQTLVLCLAPQIDARYEKIYAYLQNDLTRKNPSVDLILGLLCPNIETRLQFLSCFHPGAKLKHFRLIESSSENTAASSHEHFLRADPRLVYYALGNNALDAGLLPEVRLLPPLQWHQIAVEASWQERVQKLFHRALEDMTAQRPVFYFHGRQGVGKKTSARVLSGEIGLALAIVDLRSLVRTPETLREKTRLLLRESVLQPCAIYFEHFEKLESAAEENPALLTGLLQEMRELGGIIFLGSENRLPGKLLDLPSVYAMEISPPNGATQKSLWKYHLNGVTVEVEDVDLEQLTSRFDLTPDQIARTVRFAKQQALVENPANGKVRMEDLMTGSRAQSQPKLSALARKISPKYQWKDLVLPEEHAAQLRELTSFVKHRRVVMGDWGFERKLSLGRGLNALFTGPSGTGKTMAAEVIANELGLDLYKIDLSMVVSKYIGETEKNLSRIFTEAEHSNAILFFDEADALFGKRSEVKDAHDRYANIEIGYLLQEMEEYEGTVILATNLSKNMDEAFVRRLHFTIEFPFPTEKYRRRIWEGILPEATPRSLELDLSFMAQRFDLTGGNIRNIALGAAFLAADDGKVITMNHLLRATKREYQKMGKLVAEGEFGKT